MEPNFCFIKAKLDKLVLFAMNSLFGYSLRENIFKEEDLPF